MAGIGFKLKKAFKSHSLYSKSKGLAHAGSVTAGPWIWAVYVLAITFALSGEISSLADRNFAAHTVFYSFVLSHILLSPAYLVVTRYLADMIYLKEYHSIMPSFRGISTLVVPISIVVSSVYYIPNAVPSSQKIIGTILFAVISMTMIIMIYLSSSKDYEAIGTAFIMGSIVTIALFFILSKVFVIQTPMDFKTSVLFSILIGLAVSYILLYRVLSKSYPNNLWISYEFISYFKKVPSFVFIAMFYTLGIWSDNLIIWIINHSSPLTSNLGSIYNVTPSYDLMTVIALITIIPTAILYTVFIETEFFVNYRKFMHRINNNGTLKQINDAHMLMKTTLSKWILRSFTIQSVISSIILLTIVTILKTKNVSLMSISTVIYLIFGSLFLVYSYINLNILLYFDIRKNAIILSGVFLSINTVLTISFAYIGSFLNGMGFMIASLATLITSINMVKILMKDTVYILFSKQNVFK